MNNIRYLFTLQGALKAVTVILGFLSACIMGHAYDRSLYNNIYKSAAALADHLKGGESMGKEGYFLAMVVLFFLLSLAFLVCHIMTEELGKSPGNQFFDAGYHALGGILIFIGACLVISSAVNINKFENQLKGDNPEYKGVRMQFKSEKIMSGVLSLFNGIAYGITAWVTFVGQPNQVN